MAVLQLVIGRERQPVLSFEVAGRFVSQVLIVLARRSKCCERSHAYAQNLPDALQMPMSRVQALLRWR
jgi:hypothetical protein